MATQIKLRRDTASNWALEDPVLASGEPGYDTTNKILKIGDGSSTWTGLTSIYEPSTDIIPTADNTYDLGSPTNQWRHVYTADGSIYLGNVKLTNINGKFVATTVINPGREDEAEDPEDSDATSDIGGNANTGDITFDGNQIGVDGNNGEIKIRSEDGNDYSYTWQTPQRWEAYAENDEDGDHGAWAWIKADMEAGINNPKVFIETVAGNTGVEQRWTFDKDGALTFPDGTIQTTAYTGQNSGAIGTFFVVVNDDGRVSKSTDGVTWTAGVDTGAGINRVATDGVTVAMIQSDQLSWTTFAGLEASTYLSGNSSTSDQIGGQNIDWNQIDYAGGYFVAVGSYDPTGSSFRQGVYGYSTDGRSWTFETVDQTVVEFFGNDPVDSDWEFSDVDYNGVGWMFSVSDGGGGPGGGANGGGVYITDLTATVTSARCFSMNITYKAAWNGSAWYMEGDESIAGVNSNLDPRNGTFDGPIDPWATGIQDLGLSDAGGTVETAGGNGYLAASDSDGHVAWSDDNGQTWQIVTPIPYTRTISAITQASPAVVTDSGGSGTGANGEKVIISGSSVSGYNGTFYWKSANSSLYTDQALTTPFDTSGLAPFTGTATLTWSNGEYIDAMDYINGYFYIGNDDEQIARTTNFVSWTIVDDQTNDFEYWNDIAGFVNTGGNANTGNFTFDEDTITNGAGLILSTNRGTLAIGTNMEVPGVAGHFHIGFDGSNINPPPSDLFLGDDYNYVKLPGSQLDPNNQHGVEIGTDNRSLGPQNIEVNEVDELVPPGGVWRLFIDHEDYPNLGSLVSVGDTVTTSWGTPITATITDVIEEPGNSWKIHVAQDITAGFLDEGETVSFGTPSDSYVWRFGTDGTLTLPSGNTRIGNVFGEDGMVGNTGTGVGVGSQGQGGYAALQWIDDPEDATSVAAVIVNSPIGSSSGTVQIATGLVGGPTAENVWEFGADGVLTLPTNGTISYTPDDTDNWNDPAVNTIQAALDELAARVTALQNFEIDGGNAYTPELGELLIDGNGA